MTTSLSPGRSAKASRPAIRPHPTCARHRQVHPRTWLGLPEYHSVPRNASPDSQPGCDGYPPQFEHPYSWFSSYPTRYICYTTSWPKQIRMLMFGDVMLVQVTIPYLWSIPPSRKDCCPTYRTRLDQVYSRVYSDSVKGSFRKEGTRSSHLSSVVIRARRQRATWIEG
jgi:hypothetical protein